MTRRAWLAAAAVVSACSFGGAAEQRGDAGVLARLDAAKVQQAAAQRALQPMERDLLLLADFERDGAVLCGGTSLDVPLAPSHYRPGRFGRGFYFEKPRHNLLPPAMADVEVAIGGFRALGDARLTCLWAATAFGKRALSVMLSTTNDAVQTVPVKVACRGLSWHEKEWTLLASAHVRGPKDGKIRVEVAFVPADLPASIQNDTNQPPRIPDKAVSQEIVLTGTWQRVACTVTTDARVGEREAVFSMRSETSAPITLLADGFQFEQAAYYPHHHNMPTTWLPGGESAPATSVSITSPLKEAFPVAEGSMAFWTMTPRESNLRGQGGIFWVSFGAGWAPSWAMSTYNFNAGGAGVAYPLARGADDGAWHHVAMTWDATNAYAYLDGRFVATFAHMEKDKAKQLETYALVMGGSVSDGQAANSVMDDVAIFKRRLTDGEIQTLASAAAPLRATTAPFALARGARTVFYRDEAKARLELTAVGEAGLEMDCRLDAAIGDLVTARAGLPIRDGRGAAVVPFSPARLKCGEYLCRVAAGKAADRSAYVEFRVRVVPAPRRDLYRVMYWGGSGALAAERAYYRKLGVNTIDSYSANIEELGADGFFYNWHLNAGGDSAWTPEDRRLVRSVTAKETAWRARYPNWSGVLINSEVGSGLPNAEERARWFDAWAEKELGFPAPTNGWAMGTCNNPTQCWFPAGEKPGSNGVYRTQPQTFRFLKWWYNRGMGQWRINAEIAAEIKKARSDVITWTDPLLAPGQVADLDAASSWVYKDSGPACRFDFQESLANLPTPDKPFFGLLGAYCDPYHHAEVPGVGKRMLGMTADDVIQQCWIAAAGLAMHGLQYFSLTLDDSALSDSHKQYYQPGSLEKVSLALLDDILPIAAMLRGVPNARNPVALLLPESTLWLNNGEGNWGWGVSWYSILWKGWLGRSGLDCDVLLDHGISPESLSQYKAVIFPMAQYVSRDVFAALTAAGTAGTRIVVDAYCRHEYPNMEKWDQTYKLPPSVWSETNYNAVIEKPLARLAAELRPTFAVRAEGAEGPVLTFVREADGVKYIVVVNNLQQAGPYTEWTQNPRFKPYGKAQSATLQIEAPEDSALYEFTESRRLTPKVEGDGLAVTLDLPPHAGRVVCLYPRAMNAVQFAPAKGFRRGRSGVIRVSVVDACGHPMPGRQLITATIRDPQGNVHDESGVYRVTAGKAEITFRPALNEPAGEWKVEVYERTSGLRAMQALRVEGM